ncbi:hypothetical protein MJO28_017358 [Puccinia striiformis f. sp. tritici]|nr:hypothetical protein MJO28_017358 [Puccinia striiformis f. sp. tritici]KAI7967340.1 hypothetical protein MJO29_000617 [Puccinia striiformis f. sp. tritici]
MLYRLANSSAPSRYVLIKRDSGRLPSLRFNCYNHEDDLLYLTTERVGYPFHYNSMEQVPVLPKVVAPDYEEAYVLLEGKSQRNAAGWRDVNKRVTFINLE